MISIVVVNWNSGPLLEKCVASLLGCAPGCEIVVADNASEDHSPDFLASVRPAPVVIRNASNLGFAAANNAGWKRSSGDPVLFLNPDVECTKGAVDELEKALAGNSTIWACAGRLISASIPGRIEQSVRRLPNLASVAVEMLLLDEVWPGNPWTTHYRMQGEDLGSDREVDQPAAACLMFRRSALETTGGFDERFRPAWFEDVDLCKRISDAGGRILFRPSAQFRHQGGYSLDKVPYAKFLEYYHSNLIRYFAKHYGPNSARHVQRLVVAGMRLRAALSIFRPVARRSTRAQSFRVFSDAVRYFRESRGDAS